MAAKRYRENIISGKYIEPSKNKAQEAAITIQRYWRNYQLILYTRMRIQKQNIEIGKHTYVMPIINLKLVLTIRLINQLFLIKAVFR